MGAMEVVDGSKIPRGWASTGIRKEEWRPAEPLWTNRPNPFGLLPVFPLKERPIPPLYEEPKAFVREMPLSPQDCAPFSFGPTAAFGRVPQPPRTVRLPPHAHLAVELDAGELTTAYFRIRMQNGKGGRLTVRYAERYFPRAEDAQAGRGEVRDDSLHGRLSGHADVYFPSGADETYEPFWWRAFRFVRIEVETGGEGITLYPPACTETGYPLRVESHIQSSAGWINELWDISLRTLRRCTHETYEDCPYYEQLQYTMDARLESLFTHALGGDVRLSRKAIHDFHTSLLPEGILQSRYPSNEPQVIPAFALHWIFMLQDDYWETGEPAFIHRYRPTVDAVLDWFDRKTGALGLVENLGYWDFADWADEWSASNGTPSAARTGPSTIHNLSYARALQSAAELNRATGREGVAREYEARAASILQAVNQCCWSEQWGLYREGPDCGQYSQHAQVWAVLSGAAEGARAKRILRKALSERGLVKCSFPLQFYLFRALEKAGLYEMTFPLWELWKSLFPLHLTTVPETPAHSRSDCHGWGALPLYEFTRNILGVRPAAPGWSAIEIRPMCRMLADTKGEVSTPRGPISVEWETADGQTELTVRLPRQVCAVLRLPGSEERELRPGSSHIHVSI